MKLNHDCVRDCLLFLENNLGIYNGIAIDDVIYGISNKYDKNEIIYSLVKLSEAEYISGGLTIKHDAQGSPITDDSDIYEITWKGHEYLNTVRDNKVWKAIKEKTSPLKSVPLSITANVGTEIIKKMVGL